MWLLAIKTHKKRLAMKNKILSLFICLIQITFARNNNQFVVVVSSYNNEKWCEKNLDSIFNQNYENFKLIYINDGSSDNTNFLVKKYLAEHKIKMQEVLIADNSLNAMNNTINKICANFDAKCIYVNNLINKGSQLANTYAAIHACPDSSIIVDVDGDDQLANNSVLSYLNDIYNENNVWLTYGSFVRSSGKKHCLCKPLPSFVVTNRSYRKYLWASSHLKTYKAFLFKAICLQDLMYEKQFISAAVDHAIMLPMLEMAGDKFKHITKILYLYNDTNTQRISAKKRYKQRFFNALVRQKLMYNELHIDVAAAIQ